MYQDILRDKLNNEVSIQELQKMRDDGMTNIEIAKSLGISVMTVSRYLGLMTPEQRRAAKAKGAAAAREKRALSRANKAPEETREKAAKKAVVALPVMGMQFTMSGKTAAYKVNTEAGTIEIDGDSLAGVIPFDALQGLIEDLQRAFATVVSVSEAVCKTAA